MSKFFTSLIGHPITSTIGAGLAGESLLTDAAHSTTTPGLVLAFAKAFLLFLLGAYASDGHKT